MKKVFTLMLLVTAGWLMAITAQAQQPQRTQWATDVIIDNIPVTQTMPRIGVADNGWIYAGFVTDTSYNISVSTDEGSNWTTLAHSLQPLTDWDMVVTSDTLPNDTPVVWIAGIFSSTDLNVYSFNGITGAAKLETTFNPGGGDTLRNVAIATDVRHPGSAANPYSIGVAVTIAGSSVDSLELLVSNNAGSTWSGTAIMTSVDFLHRVSMAYGHSKSKTTGTFFIAVEENIAPGATNFSNTNIAYMWEDEDFSQSSWGTLLSPQYGFVNETNSAWTGTVSHPGVIVTNDTTDNDSSDISEMITFISSPNGLRGVSSMTAYTNPNSPSHWFGNYILNKESGVQEPTPANGCFNDGFKTMVFTAGDTVGQTLSYYSVNMNNVDDSINWTPLQSNYNDGTFSLVSPDPHCAINPSDSTGVADWIGNSGSSTYTLYDAEDRLLGIATVNSTLPDVKIYPSPADNYVDVTVSNQFKSSIKVEVFNMLGQSMYLLPQTGNDLIKVNTTQWAPGAYFVRLTDGTTEQVKKFVVEHE